MLYHFYGYSGCFADFQVRISPQFIILCLETRAAGLQLLRGPVYEQQASGRMLSSFQITYNALNTEKQILPEHLQLSHRVVLVDLWL